MRYLGLIVILFISGYCSAESSNPTQKIKVGETQKQTNKSGWQYANWGMTAEQIVEASHGKARAVFGEEQRNKSNPYYFDCLAVSDFKTGPFEFDVSFRAKLNETTLNSVYLSLRNTNQYEELKDSLASKYGQGVTSIKGKQITTSWQTKSEVIELVDIRDALRFVSLTYSKRVYGPRGLDL
ncbi:hypothetical protein [Acinetobacter tjernbergiae]|jgi:hypothetical protein|uniref:Uncharacterized protein n=1 Tax=Acinetobacter tjernbergiae DSM 14971 = CIP 107465 TaxID=1120928 RepID=V2WC46_9GAMM|nr:hypothetical protein [Acinetobacter tjernbergiae]ESK57599.1 hypothetical protein F990_00135 [Acinetobacter tjernbergiae DSM 14971 = CIP 107465]